MSIAAKRTKKSSSTRSTAAPATKSTRSAAVPATTATHSQSQSIPPIPPIFNSSSSTDDIAPEDHQQRKKKKHQTSLSVKVSYNGRKVGGEVFECTSLSEKSETKYGNQIRGNTSKDYTEVRFDDIVPLISASLQSMEVPVEWDDKLYNVMSPVLLPDGSITKTIDTTPRAFAYHKLQLMDIAAWRPTSPIIHLRLCVIPKLLSEKPPVAPTISKNVIAKTTNIPNSGLEIIIYSGGKKCNGKWMTDHSSKPPETKLLGSRIVDYPIDRDKLVEAADGIMTHSLLQRFSEGDHVITRETIDLVPSGPKKRGGAIPMLNQAVEIPDTFEIEDSFLGPLKICVFKRDTPEGSSSLGGSRSLTAIETDAKVAQQKVTDTIMSSARKSSIGHSSVKGISFGEGLSNLALYQQGVEELVEGAYEKIDKRDKSVSGITEKLFAYIDQLPRTQATSDSLPDSVFITLFPKTKKKSSTSTSQSSSLPPPPTSLSLIDPDDTSTKFRQFCSTINDGAAGGDQDLFTCRSHYGVHENNACESLALKHLEEAIQAKIKVDILLMEDCGKGSRFTKKGTWFLLSKVCSGPQSIAENEDTFVLLSLATGVDGNPEKIRLKRAKFEEKEVPLESDDDLVQLEED
jgi:hypothetical protein